MTENNMSDERFLRFLLFTLRGANSTNQIAGYRSRDRNSNSYQLYSMILFFVSKEANSTYQMAGYSSRD